MSGLQSPPVPLFVLFLLFSRISVLNSSYLLTNYQQEPLINLSTPFLVLRLTMIQDSSWLVGLVSLADSDGVMLLFIERRGQRQDIPEFCPKV